MGAAMGFDASAKKCANGLHKLRERPDGSMLEMSSSTTSSEKTRRRLMREELMETCQGREFHDLARVPLSRERPDTEIDQSLRKISVALRRLP